MSGGILARGDFVLGGFWLGGFCLGGFCPGGFCPGGFCPGGFCPRTIQTPEIYERANFFVCCDIYVSLIALGLWKL